MNEEEAFARMRRHAGPLWAVAILAGVLAAIVLAALALAD